MQLWMARFAALAAALSLLVTLSMSKRGLFRCLSDGTWHVVACCAATPVERDVTADEPACCAHADVSVADQREETAAITPLVPPLSRATTLFAAVRWGTLDLPEREAHAGPQRPPPPTSARRLALLSTLVS